MKSRTSRRASPTQGSVPPSSRGAAGSSTADGPGSTTASGEETRPPVSVEPCGPCSLDVHTDCHRLDGDTCGCTETPGCGAGLRVFVAEPSYRCENCGHAWDPTSTRWLCPLCRWKSTCCEGAPL